jgi:hypothetical protein
MDQHVRQFGILTVAMSIAGLVVSLVLLTVPETGGFLARTTGWKGLRVILIGFAVFNIALAIPSIIAANALFNFQEWARDLLIVISALNILNVPFGPLLGAYGLWVLLSPETDPLFIERPRRGGGTRRRRVRDMLGKRFRASREDEQRPILPSKADLHP